MAKRLRPYMLTAPLLILSLILITGLINSVIQSLGYIPALGLKNMTLNYYREILGTPDFRDSLLLSLYICGLSSALSVVAGVAICAALVAKGKWIMNYIIRIPILIPHTVVALFIVIILSGSGMLSRLFYAAGIVSAPQEFPNIIYNQAGLGVILGYVWKQAPFVAFFTLSLMESISKTMEEAAINLGASPVRAFFSVTLPLSMPAILNALMIIMAFSFGAYELPFLLGMTKPKALPVLAYIEYTHPDLKHRPYAMAMNGIMIAVSLLMACIYFFLMNRRLRRLKHGKQV